MESVDAIAIESLICRHALLKRLDFDMGIFFDRFGPNSVKYLLKALAIVVLSSLHTLSILNILKLASVEVLLSKEFINFQVLRISLDLILNWFS